MALLQTLVILLLSARVVLGVTTDVLPGPGTPLQDAIDAASPGDRLRLNGDFFERIVIDKPLRLAAHPSLSFYARILGDCTGTSVTVAADQVTLNRVFVTQGTPYDIDVQGRNRVTLRSVGIEPGCAGAQYGVNVFQSTRVKLMHPSTFAGSNIYQDAGIYIGGIPTDGQVQVVGGYVQDSVRGILLEDSPNSRIGVRRNTVVAVTDGIFLNNTQGASVANNDVELSTHNGIWANAMSTANRIIGNRVSDSVNLDVVDDSNNNCWLRNTFQTGTVNENGCN